VGLGVDILMLAMMGLDTTRGLDRRTDEWWYNDGIIVV